MHSLTPKQQEAVDNIFGPVMVIAGPGTGKTQVLSARIANILKKTDTHPKNILALTFTESGVQAMKERLLQFIGTDAFYTEIHTFHSFALKIINDYEDKFLETAEFSVATPLEKIIILRNILDDGNYKELKILDDPYFFVRRIEKALSVLKRENITSEKLKELAALQKEKELLDPKNCYKKTGLPKPNELARINKQYAKQIELALILSQYKKRLIDAKKRDFDDIISEVVSKLLTDEDLRLSLQENFLFILVDEYQDTNNAQNEIVQSLIENVESPNIFIVGDDDQSIYRFQGASVANIVGFTSQIDQTRMIVLNDNFRSTQTILNAALSTIEKNQNRLSNIITGLEKSFKANVKYEEEKISVLKFENNKLEGYFVARQINELLSKGISPMEICVIARKNHDLDDIVEELETLGIPFDVTRDNNVLEDNDIRKLITLLRLIQNPYDDNLMYAVLNFHFFNIPSLAALKLRESAREKKICMFEYLTLNDDQEELKSFKEIFLKWIQECQNLPFLYFFKLVIKDVKFVENLLEMDLKIEKLNCLYSLFEEIKQKNYGDKSFHLEQFLSYIDLLYKYDISIKEETIKSEVASVKLMTAHSSKGLEFEYVFLIKCIDRNWGNSSNNSDIKLPDEIVVNSKVDLKERNEDERRLFYVALTRAKKQIYITYPLKNGNSVITTSCNPSMFLFEINDEYKQTLESNIYEEEYLAHIIKKIEHIPTSHIQEKEYLDKLIKSLKLNATSLNLYLECSQKFKLSSLLKLPTTKSLRLSFGTAMHKAYEIFFDKLKREIPTLDDFIKYYEIALSNEILTQSEMEELLVKGKDSIIGYFEKYKDTFSPPLYTELDFKKRNVYFEGIQLTGKIDKIDILDPIKKTVKIIDYKTGRSKSKNEIEGKTKKQDTKYVNQLMFYKLLLESDRNFGFTPTEGELDFIEGKDNKYSKVVLEYQDKQMVNFKELVKDTIGKIKNQEFEKTTNRKLCEECPFNKICWGG